MILIQSQQSQYLNARIMQKEMIEFLYRIQIVKISYVKRSIFYEVYFLILGCQVHKSEAISDNSQQKGRFDANACFFLSKNSALLEILGRQKESRVSSEIVKTLSEAYLILTKYCSIVPSTQQDSLLPAFGSWSLVSGCWSLVTGHWLLVTGIWLLVTGRWKNNLFKV